MRFKKWISNWLDDGMCEWENPLNNIEDLLPGVCDLCTTDKLGNWSESPEICPHGKWVKFVSEEFQGCTNMKNDIIIEITLVDRTGKSIKCVEFEILLKQQFG